MNSKGINRNVWALTLSLCLGVTGFSTFSAQAADPPKMEVPKSPPTGGEMKQPVPGKGLGQGEVETLALQCDESFNGPHCWCKIRVGCTGYIVKDFGGICRYRQIASGKQKDCAERCTKAAQQYGTPAVQASGAAICSKMGAGTWAVYAYSVVGASDWQNNACDTDQGFGSVTCKPPVCTAWTPGSHTWSQSAPGGGPSPMLLDRPTTR